ncbi:MAG TPA: ribonuclease R, partial [Gemmataceae bacterium]|nr:ribonuclease R [Gemmataceae bacterium]
KMSVPASQYNDFRRALSELLNKGRVERGKNHTIRKAQPHGTIVGIFRRTGSGLGFVRPHLVDGKAGPEILIRENNALDAVTGDEVVVKLIRKPSVGDAKPVGIILEIVERASREFVGVYFERDEQGYVRVDGTVFSHSIYVGDPGAKGAKPEDKVVIEILRFPSAEDRGEGVITEVLGPRGQPGVDTLSVIREFGLPDRFPDDVLEEAREAATAFDEDDLEGRTDFTADTVITIDPADARDFDDAVSLTHDSRSKHWHLTVHIADVAHFAPPGSLIDREARKRGTSVYLPQRVLPMFPEVISNAVASLQQDRVRFVKSVQMDFTSAGQRTETHFANGAIKVKRRFTYEQVFGILEDTERGGEQIEPEVLALLRRMHDLAMILRKRRLKRGAIELDMPETELEFDDQGRVSGAHTQPHDVSHQIIEEFMLAANEAVAEKLAQLGVPFLRRIHPSPDPLKLEAFAEFARSLGYKIGKNLDRFTLQRIMVESSGKPEAYAMHYGLLRSLKQAVYSPLEEGHFALASETYCHFTSPIRRYPDLTVHRLLDRWLRSGKAGADETELAALGDHCSKTEKRAEVAERELIKVKLLDYMSRRIGEELQIIITGVAEYGFFGQATDMPIEGLVHVSTLTDDYYYYEKSTHSLIGRRTQKRYRLGDRVNVTVVRVDQQRRQLDFRVEAKKGSEEIGSEKRKWVGKKRRHSR